MFFKMMCKCSHFVGLFVFLLLFCFRCCADGAGNIQCIAKERDALFQFKHDIRVDHCGLLNSWVGQECCQWHGIHCSNHSGHVVRLDVSGTPYEYLESTTFCIEGTVSPSLTELKHLKYLDLSYNNFQGQLIPSFIGSLLSLKHLNLSNSNFVGEVPHQLANLSSLTSLDLSGNHFNQHLYVKDMRWLSYLNLLTDINLSSVHLDLATDWMQIITNLPLLRSLHMDYCRLSSHIPSSLLEYTNSSTTLHILSLHENNLKDTMIIEWLSNFTRLSSTFAYLALSSNRFSDPIPSSFGNMHSLLYIDLSYNRFEGPIPETISNLKHLVHLDLSENNLQGSKWNPEVLGSLCSLQILSLGENNISSELSTIIKPLSQCVHKSLVSLDIRGNRVWGSLPNEIYTFSSLRELDLGYNQLNGAISHSLGKLSVLEKLDLSMNQLNGTISPTLGQLLMLEKLDLSYNSLKGTISNHHLSSLSRLTVLDLSYNQELVLNISANWVPPFQLDVIGLRFCKIGPYFPKWLLTQTNFSTFDISNSIISDPIPTSFWHSLPPNLRILKMSGNMIRGNIPDVPILLQNLASVNLSSNLFHGAIPSFLRNASMLFLNDNNFSECASFFRPRTKVGLYALGLSNNKLSGELPSSWGYFDQLTYLYMDDNNFSGSLPSTMGMLTQLEYLHLRKNNISGKFPTALQNCSELVMLDLSYNSLTGALPNRFGNSFTSLAYLSLRNNDFYGGLPFSLCEMSSLQILDISKNGFAGFIPECFHHFTAMISRTIGNLDDIGSAWIMWKRAESDIKHTVDLVKAIDMSNNKLEGPIPDGISRLTGLISLDMSRNRLNGSITPNIGQLTSLEYLDLSRNKICGEIPSSLSTVSSLGTLDVSYNNLSGRIPHGTQLQGFSASSYIGNLGHCGDPLPRCPGDPTPANSPKEDTSSHQDDDDDDNDNIFPGLYISVVLGFIVGFWGVCGALVIKRSWRHKFFKVFDDIKDKLYTLGVVNKARVLRRNT